MLTQIPLVHVDGQIVQRCSSLQSIDVSSCFLIMDGDVEAMLKACPGLRTIKLRGCRMISDKAIDAMIQHGPTLEVRVALAVLVSHRLPHPSCAEG